MPCPRDWRARRRRSLRRSACTGAPGSEAVSVGRVNAARHFAQLMPSEAIRRLAALRVVRFDATEVAATAPRGLDVDQARDRVIDRWECDLCGLLNAMTRGELSMLASRLALAGE